MLHLSLLRLPRALPRWRRFDPYHAHQLAWKAFADVPRGERPFLLSVDERGSHHSLLVQSTRSPDWAFLDGDANVRVKTFDPDHIPLGEPLRFFLRANPTVDRRGFHDGKKRRIAVGTNPDLAFQQMGRPQDAPTTAVERAEWRNDQLRNWLQSQGDRGGFDVDACEPGPIVARRIVRTENGRPKGRPMTFHEVEFTGTLRVTDREAFARICARGLGRGKAFGYGLLMVRPV
jgi:CRISPR system Cascade subunit CasE